MTCPIEEWKAAHKRGELELKSWDRDRVGSDREIECCASLSSSNAACMQ